MAPQIVFSLDVSPDIQILHPPAYWKYSRITLPQFEEPGSRPKSYLPCFSPDHRQLQSFAWKASWGKLPSPHRTWCSAMRCSFLGGVCTDLGPPRPAVHICISVMAAPPVWGLSWSIFSALIQYFSTPSPSPSPLLFCSGTFCSGILGSETVLPICAHLSDFPEQLFGENSTLGAGASFACPVAVTE